MSKKKKFIIAIVITLVVLGAIIAVLAMLKNKTKEKKVVSVVPVEMIYMPAEYMEYNNTLYGYVDVSLEQKIYLSSTDVIEEICVTEGQQVKAGDVILKYDMTARELELEMMRASVEQARVDVLVAERELEELKAIVPVEELPEPPTTEEQPSTEVQEPSTEEQEPSTEEQQPSTEEQEPSTEEQEPSTEEQQPSTEEQEPSTEEQEPSTEEQQPSIGEPNIDDETLRTSNPLTEEPSMPEDVVEQPEEKTYTKEELEALIAEKQSEIKSLQIEYQLSQIDLELLEYQSENGEVLCNFDGVVTSVKDPEEANLNGEPYIVVSGTNGYSVKASIGELSLDKVSIGDEVEMYCYENGSYYTGVITEISDTPTSDGGYSTMTETFYPITIAIADGEGLSSYMGMDITMPTNDSEDSGFYISLAYVASENGKYYVLKDNNGKLEKAYIKTGAIMWGDSIKVLGGLSIDDYIAFPHSSDAKEGVRTKKDDGSMLFY